MKNLPLYMILVLLVSFKNYAVEVCEPVKSTHIYFINGALGESDKFFSQLARVRAIYGTTVYGSYISSDREAAIDSLEMFSQKSTEHQIDEHVAARYFRAKHVGYDPGLPENPQLEEFMDQAWSEVIEDNIAQFEDSIQSLNDPDFESMLFYYRSSLNFGHNVVLLGYSQGSLYAKFAYLILVNENPDWANRIGLAGAGALVSGFPGKSTYMTYHNDVWVNRLRILRPPILPANFQRQRDYGKNHYFEDYFGVSPDQMENSHVAYPESEWGTLRNNVRSVIGQLDQEICWEEEDPPEPPPSEVIPCGSTVSEDGGSEGLNNFPMFLGTISGRVEGQFTAYTIKDGLIIKDQKGATKYSTGGLVSGDKPISFNHNGDEDNQYVYISVDGNSDANTRWALFLGCPGDDVDDHLSGLTASISHTILPGSSTCTSELYIDGAVADTVTGKNHLYYSTKIAPGQHSIRRKTWCSCAYSFPDCIQDVTGSFRVNGSTTVLDNNNTYRFNVSDKNNNKSLGKVEFDDLLESYNSKPGPISNLRASTANTSGYAFVDMLDAEPHGEYWYGHLYQSNDSDMLFDWDKPLNAITRLEYKVDFGIKVRNENIKNIQWSNYTTFSPYDSQGTVSSIPPKLESLIDDGLVILPIGLPNPEDADYISVHFRFRSDQYGNPSDWKYTKGIRIYSDGSTPPVNASPTCASNINISLGGIPAIAGPVTVQMGVSTVLSSCSDPNGDTLEVISPSTMPYQFTIAAGQTKVINFAVSDGKGGTDSGTVTYIRN